MHGGVFYKIEREKIPDVWGALYAIRNNQPMTLGIITAQTACRKNGNAHMLPQRTDTFCERMRRLRVLTMADADFALRKTVCAHFCEKAVKHVPYAAMHAAHLNFALRRADADPPDPKFPGKIARKPSNTSAFDEILKGGQRKRRMNPLCVCG